MNVPDFANFCNTLSTPTAEDALAARLALASLIFFFFFLHVNGTNALSNFHIPMSRLVNAYRNKSSKIHHLHAHKMIYFG